MDSKIGPLLKHALSRISAVPAEQKPLIMNALAAHYDIRGNGTHMPFFIKFTNLSPAAGEAWEDFRKRALARLRQRAVDIGHPGATPLFLSHSLASALPPHEIAAFAQHADVERVELDPTVMAATMDVAFSDLGMPDYLKASGGLTGHGVRVAVLDSGVDTEQPFLQVEDSVSTADEPVEIPGQHGTHCAGSIASRDDTFRGIAPGVPLLNIKVLKANGTGTSTSVVRGLEQALEMKADVASLSLGFNHLPVGTDGGHGWTCTAENKCVMCTAVDNATALGLVVCVAAGNDHLRADTLRKYGQADSFDTELGCPGQAAGAITVGAVSKQTFEPAYFSSNGPTSYGASKPDLSCDGVSITSTVPVPRNPDGTVKANPSRNDLFFRLSGTSMATPMVAAACALIIQSRRSQGLSAKPEEVRSDLLARCVTKLAYDANVVGAGRLNMAAGLDTAPVT